MSRLWKVWIDGVYKGTIQAQNEEAAREKAQGIYNQGHEANIYVQQVDHLAVL